MNPPHKVHMIYINPFLKAPQTMCAIYAKIYTGLKMTDSWDAVTCKLCLAAKPEREK